MLDPGTRCWAVARRAVLAIAIVGALAGCGGAASVPPAATPTVEPTEAPTATPEPTPEPTPKPEPTIDLGALGDAYLAIAATLLETVTPLYASLESGEITVLEASDVYFDLSQAYRATADGLDALEYPAEVRPDVDEIVDVLNQLADEFAASSDDPNLDNYELVDELLAQVPEIGGRIRAQIGLPPPPTNPPG